MIIRAVWPCPRPRLSPQNGDSATQWSPLGLKTASGWRWCKRCWAAVNIYTHRIHTLRTHTLRIHTLGTQRICTHCSRNLHLIHPPVNVYTSALARVVHRTNLPRAKTNESFSSRPKQAQTIVSTNPPTCIAFEIDLLMIKILQAPTRTRTLRPTYSLNSSPWTGMGIKHFSCLIG